MTALSPDAVLAAVSLLLDCAGDEDLTAAILDEVGAGGDAHFADAPGTHPPHPGLVFDKAKHRWVKPSGQGPGASGEGRGGTAEHHPAGHPAHPPAAGGDHDLPWAEEMPEPGRIVRAKAALAQKLARTRGGRAVLAMGAKGMKAFHAVEHRLLYAMKKTEELAAEAARERGMPPEKVEKLKRVLYAADFLGGYATGAAAAAIGLPIIAIKATMVGPSASVLYLAYSSARNPAATFRAAKKVVGETFAKGKPGETARHSDVFAAEADQAPRELAGMLADRVAKAADADWFVAVYVAALAETGDTRAALELADRATEEQPAAPASPPGGGGEDTQPPAGG